VRLKLNGKSKKDLREDRLGNIFEKRELSREGEGKEAPPCGKGGGEVTRKHGRLQRRSSEKKGVAYVPVGNGPGTNCRRGRGKKKERGVSFGHIMEAT